MSQSSFSTTSFDPLPDIQSQPTIGSGANMNSQTDVLWSLRPVRWARTQGALICILALQLALTSKLRNTAFQDEATYLYSGHRQLDLWLHGIPTYDQYTPYFSGAPFLYPVLGALADDVGGLQGARSLSLLFALCTTLLLYLTARRLFDRRIALSGAALFAVSEPTLFNGSFATYDAAVQLLLALAVWIGVRTASWWTPAAVLPAPFLVLAGLTKYAAVLYIPAAILVCAIARAQGRGFARATIGGIALTAVTVGLFGAALTAAPQLIEGIQNTTVGRSQRPDPPWSVASAAAAYIGLTIALAIVGAFIYCRRHPPPALAGTPRYCRVLLSVVAIAIALAAPANQMHIHTLQSLHKHVGFGLWFLTPLAGVAIAQLITKQSFRGLAAATSICAAVAWAGTAQAETRYHDWPNSENLVSTLQTMGRPVTGRYLVEEHEVPRYYLRDLLEPYQWIGTSEFQYERADGTHFAGLAAYKAALADKYFDAVALRYGPTKDLDLQLAKLLNASDDYELVATVPLNTSFGEGAWHVWRRN